MTCLYSILQTDCQSEEIHTDSPRDSRVNDVNASVISEDKERDQSNSRTEQAKQHDIWTWEEEDQEKRRRKKSNNRTGMDLHSNSEDLSLFSFNTWWWVLSHSRSWSKNLSSLVLYPSLPLTPNNYLSCESKDHGLSLFLFQTRKARNNLMPGMLTKLSPQSHVWFQRCWSIGLSAPTTPLISCPVLVSCPVLYLCI